MVRADAHRRLLLRQRAAAEGLRREVLGEDGSLRHPYFRDLTRHLRAARAAPASRADLRRACATADLVYVGDFHAAPACQLLAADLLRAMEGRSRPLGLGIEFLYTRQQRWLDERQAGRLDDPAFLRRVHYREEWGYPWEGFAALLDAARKAGVPVHALDVPPRGGFEGLARRDAHAARRIAALLADPARPRMLVLFGESHLSRGHIPRRVAALTARAGVPARPVTVFQDPDLLYWAALRTWGKVPEVVRVDPETFAVFHGSPLQKYEAYRQVLERWRGDTPPDEEVDLTPACHHLIGVLMGWLGIRPDRHRLRHAGWAEDLVDALPEVYSGPDAADLLDPILEEHGRTSQERAEARALLASRGAMYDARSNTLFLRRYLPGAAAGEGARFLRSALTGRLFAPPESEGWEPADRVYGAAYTEALAGLGARLVDPASAFPRGEAPDAEEAAEAPWLMEHRRFERSSRTAPPAPLRDALRRSRPLRRRLARDLGRRAARVLFEEVRKGTLDRKGLRALFTRPLDGPRARRQVLGIVRRG